MIALCPNCHAVKTRGRTRERLRDVMSGVARGPTRGVAVAIQLATQSKARTWPAPQQCHLAQKERLVYMEVIVLIRIMRLRAGRDWPEMSEPSFTFVP
jgi:hypothetical protein